MNIKSRTKSSYALATAGFLAACCAFTPGASAWQAGNMPPIVPASQAGLLDQQASEDMLLPATAPADALNSPAHNMLTPRISAEVAEESQSDLQTVSGQESVADSYRVASAGMQHPVYQHPIPIQSRAPSGPPLVQGNGVHGNRQLAPAPITSSRQYVPAPPAGPTFYPASSTMSPRVLAPRALAPMQEPASAPAILPLEPIQTENVQGNTVIESPETTLPPLQGQGSVVSPDTVIGESYIQPVTDYSAPVIGCNSCGQSNCGGDGGCISSCASCGTDGCFDINTVDNRFAACGFISRARQYFILDVLYMTRTDGEVRAMNLSPINDFGYGFGLRATVGRRQDAASGREFTYFGSYDIDESGTVTDAAGRIQRLFVPDGTFLTAASLAPFSNVVTSSEQIETTFQSFEYNRVRWGWDVVKVIFGTRYVFLQDEYLGNFQNNVGQNGTIDINATNHLIGPQVGIEMFYDVGYRWSLSGFGKVGAMHNVFDEDFNVSSDGFSIINSGGDSTDFAWMVDLGLTAHYQLTSRARFRAGYNLLFFGDVTTADEAFPTVFSPFSSSSLDAEDDAVFHGLSLGLEIYR